MVLLKNRVLVKISKKGLIKMLTSINFKTNVEAAIQLYVHPEHSNVLNLNTIDFIHCYTSPTTSLQHPDAKYLLIHYDTEYIGIFLVQVCLLIGQSYYTVLA